MALLGEMYYTPNNLDAWYNLPQDGGISYAAQESWVLNETVRVSYFIHQYYCTIVIDNPPLLFEGQHHI